MHRYLLTALLTAVCATAVSADVRTDEKTQIKLEGMMGRMMNMFGGSAAREGTVSTVAVKGNRKATRTDNNGQIIDLAEEKVYSIDFKNKSYTVMTFADMRRQMEEARKRATEQAAKAGTQPQQQADQKESQVDIDFDLKESGQTREISGFSAREVIMTITVREKGKKLEEAGGMVMTNNLWLTPKIAAMNEVAAFDLRYAQKLNASAMFDAQQMAALTAMYPMMSDAMKKFEAENVNMKGTPVLTVVKTEAVSSAEQAKQQQQAPAAQEAPKGVGGLGGALGGRLGRRILGGNKDDAAPDAASTPGRATVMTMTHELLKVTPTVADADVAIPAGFKLKS